MNVGIREASRLPRFAVLNLPAAAHVDYDVLPAQSLAAAYEGSFPPEYH